MKSSKILLLGVMLLGILFDSCQTIERLESTQTAYEQFVPRKPEVVPNSYLEPHIKPNPQTPQRQRKGDITISCEIKPFQVDSVMKYKKEAVWTDRPGFDHYEIFNLTPLYKVTPDGTHEEIQFNINVKNFQDRILKLNDVAVVTIIDGVQYSIPNDNLVEWKSGLLVKDFEKNYVLRGPELTSLRNARVIYISINDVPILYGPAGEVLKKENFEWFFELSLMPVNKQSVINYTYEYSPVEKRKCSSCGGTGGIVTKRQCGACNGRGSLLGLTCSNCGGSGAYQQRATCSQCNGSAALFYPKSQIGEEYSVTWSGWKVLVKTNPPGAKINSVDIYSGEYRNLGAANKQINWYSSDLKSYPIIVEYQGKSVKVLPYRKNGNPSSSVFIDFSNGGALVKKGQEVTE